MGSAHSSAIIPVEILVKVNVVAKMWIALEPLVLAKDRPTAFLIPRKKSRQTAPNSAATSLMVKYRPEPVGHSILKSSP